MTFAEKLLAEWYEYKGYFVKTNIRINKLKTGGYGGEMDVVAYNPKINEMIHIEVSGEAISWKKKKEKIEDKFKTAKESYEEEFQFECPPIKQIVVVGVSKPRKEIEFDNEIQLKSFTEQFGEICHELKKVNPTKKVVPEKYPIIRTIQFTLWFGPQD